MIIHNLLRVFPMVLIVSFLSCPAFPAEPDSVTFVFPAAGQDGYWPGETIMVNAVWESSADSLECIILNHDRMDSVSIVLIPDTEDTNSASASLAFLTGWELADPMEDELLQCGYGDRLSITASGVADSCRILVEKAGISISPSENVFVGSEITLLWSDRDANLDYGRKDSVSIMLRSTNTGHEQTAILRETSAQSGLFNGTVSLTCDLAAGTDSLAVRVVDADTVLIQGVDSLSTSGGWTDEIESSLVDTTIGISTRTAVIEARHNVYGDLSLFPIAGDTIIITVHEHDLEGVEAIQADVCVYRPDGTISDSLEVMALEDSSGQFSTALTVDTADADISAETGDSLYIAYHDRADSAGIPALVKRSYALGATIVQGDIPETVWDSGIPYLMVDSSTVVAGRELQVAGGVRIQVVPGKNIALIIDGTLHMGSDSNTDTVHIGASSTRNESDQWAGIVVRGSANLSRTALSGARIGISAGENGTVSIHDCLFEYNGDVAEEVLFERCAVHDDAYVHTFPPGFRGWPGALSATNADLSVSGVKIRHSDGYGISVFGGTCDIDSVAIVNCTGDALLMVETIGTVSHATCRENRSGGIYGYGSDISLSECYLELNTLEGVYSVGGSVTIDDSELGGNLNGGLWLRDDCLCTMSGVLIAGNHRAGLDAAWGSRLDIDGSAVVGNGGTGLSLDYETTLIIHNSSIAYNRMYAVHVGSWSLDDSLDATQCWWGEFPPGTDSTGVNLDAVWDGYDIDGRSKVIVFPALEMPPPAPAPQEDIHEQAGVLELSSGWAGTGDTIQVRFIPEDFQPVFDYVAAGVLSPRDTLFCILGRNDTAMLFEKDIVISETVDSLAPDRIAASYGDRITAYLLADTTISTEILSAEHPSENADALYMDVFPSPFSEVLNIRWSAASPSVLGIYDIGGRELLRRDLAGTKGMHQMNQLRLKALPPGVYILRLTDNTHALSRRIVHIR